LESFHAVANFNFNLLSFKILTLPDPEYMTFQKELTWSMRRILLDGLAQIHAWFRLLPETFFLCVNIVDRFLSASVVSCRKLNLLGVTCLFIASKVEEIVAPSIRDFLRLTVLSHPAMLLAEQYVLKTIDWNLYYANPIHFFRLSKADDDGISSTIGAYLLEVSALEWRLLATPPSLVAAAAIWLSRLIIGKDERVCGLCVIFTLLSFRISSLLTRRMRRAP
jgi:G2/mitotic-specific cyclin 1/2